MVNWATNAKTEAHCSQRNTHEPQQWKINFKALQTLVVPCNDMLKSVGFVQLQSWADCSLDPDQHEKSPEQLEEPMQQPS